MDFLDIDSLHKLLVVLINTIAIWLMLVVALNGKPKRRTNAFIAMGIVMLMWVDFAYFARLVDSSEASITLLKIAWFGSLPFSYFIFYFTVDLMGKRKKYSKAIQVSLIITTLMTLVTIFSDFVIKGVDINGHGLSIVYGFGMIPFLLNVTYLLIMNIYVVSKEWGKKKEDTQRSLKPFVLGLLSFYLLNVIFNVVLPMFFGLTRYYYFGNYSTLILTSVIAYSIVKHGFMNVKVAVSAFMVSTIGVLLVIDIFILTEFTSQQLLKGVIFVLYLIVASLLFKTMMREQKQREKLAKAKLRIENLAREQKDIIDVMGHEIRTPLTAIVQQVNLNKEVVFPHKEKMMSCKLEKEKQQKYMKYMFDGCETIDKASIHAVALVNDMLETARLDKGKFTLDYEEFNLVEIADDVVSTMSKTVKEGEVDINIKKGNLKTFNVSADKTRIREATYALINNSIKYKDSDKPKTIIDLKLIKDGKYAVVEIKDNGIGMKKSDIPKLGKKFMRLGSNMNGHLKRPGGTGLGLYVVKGIMEKHKGRLLIDSDGFKKGSTFTLRFPIAK